MKKIITLSFLLIQISLFSQITIDVHPNFRHTVGDLDTFNRKRMVKIHADQSENEWAAGNNFGTWTELRDSFLNGYDVYLGRNTGGVSWHGNQVAEDPTRPGFADPADIASRGQTARNNYANNPVHELFESRNELVIAAQQRPFYPDGTLNAQGWAFANGTATGEYMGRFVNEFHGGNGQPRPTYIEIMNEPLYEFVTVGPLQPLEIFNFHNDAADAIRAQVDDIPIGGYCAAFPDFEVNDFQRWHDRWKLFMDTSGEKMDFWSIHFYDFNLDWNNDVRLRRGSNLEATMDMIDHYSMLSFGEVKPYVISEFGGRALTMESSEWTPLRDWFTLKSWTSMLLTFSERPQDILSAIPFVIVKAFWGVQDNGNPYPWRLMRQNFELPGSTGNFWEFTEMVKFYQLWSDVKGTRIDTRSTDPDIQCNAFVEGNKMYLILNNLYFDDTEVKLNLVEQQGNVISNIRVKHLYLDEAAETPMLDEDNFSTLDNVVIGAEGSMVIEYTYQDDVMVNEFVDETKYFADTYLTPIVPFTEHTFNINGVDKGDQGEAVLRLGMGRPHGLSLQPTVKINGFEIPVPSNYAGYDQLPRPSWFGVIEVPVPFYFLQENNVITVQFSEAGGHISTMAMRVYNHSDEVVRSDEVAVTDMQLLPAQKYMLPSTDFQLITQFTPNNATNPSLTWESDNNTIATVDSFGNVSALALGTAIITATDDNSGVSASSTIEVVDSIPFISVFGINVNPPTLTIMPTESFQLQTIISPSDATDQSVMWTSADPSIVTVDTDGLVEGIIEGTTTITATTVDGSISDSSVVTVLSPIAPSLEFVNEFTHLNFDYQVGGEIVVDAAFHAGTGNTVVDGGNGGVKFWLREIEPGWTVANDYIVSDASVIGQESGVAQGTISLVGIPASNELPTDNFYFLFVTFQNSNGQTFDKGIYPINIVNSTSVADLKANQLEVFPNPAQSVLNIKNERFDTDLQLQLISSAGQLIEVPVLSQNSSTIQLDISQLPQGLYMVKLVTDRVYSATFVKQTE
ncbi:MAG: Ig-like domain-containing protein [Bacteroidota bacterium]